MEDAASGNMSFRPELMGPHLASIAIALLLAVAAWKRPNLGRALFVVLFALASLLNTYVALTAPDQYLDYAKLTESPVYRAIILGPFARHIVEYVLAIACGQAMIALGLTMRGLLARGAAVGGIVFLVAIAPLGVGSAFPSSLILAGGLAVLLRRGLDETLLGVLHLRRARSSARPSSRARARSPRRAPRPSRRT